MVGQGRCQTKVAYQVDVRDQDIITELGSASASNLTATEFQTQRRKTRIETLRGSQEERRRRAGVKHHGGIMYWQVRHWALVIGKGGGRRMGAHNVQGPVTMDARTHMQPSTIPGTKQQQGGPC